MSHDILIVDDEADIRLLIEGILQDEGYNTRNAADSSAALEALSEAQPDLIILDIWLENSKLDGLQLLKEIKKRWPEIPVVMISGHGNIETAVNAIKLGAYEFIEKPFKADRLLLVVARATEAAALRRENAELKQLRGPESSLIGDCSAIIQLRHQVQKVAPTGSRVLITGPAGAGKEVVARQIHTQSRRSDGPFIVLNCATMHPDRLESELFGIEEDGEIKVGTFEQAHEGTLLLDEVADMPQETQGKIVRALQEQTFERVGGSDKVEVDVRVIAATNKDLTEAISEGRFREDLYYRLNVVPLQVPALMERQEDLPQLVAHFMEKSAVDAGMPVRLLADDAIAALQGYDWPGNVRQLRNAIDWMLIMAPGNSEEPIRSDMLPPDITGGGASVGGGSNQSEYMSLSLRQARERFEKQYLETQVARFGGNISRTAAFIGMERSALHRKLRSLGINTSER
ncbi:nitrogen assimilation response regulator NtrX [Rhodovibrionaceae bacterium A322]